MLRSADAFASVDVLGERWPESHLGYTAHPPPGHNMAALTCGIWLPLDRGELWAGPRAGACRVPVGQAADVPDAVRERETPSVFGGGGGGRGSLCFLINLKFRGPTRVACVEGPGVGGFGLRVPCRRPQAGFWCQERPLDFPQHRQRFRGNCKPLPPVSEYSS